MAARNLQHVRRVAPRVTSSTGRRIGWAAPHGGTVRAWDANGVLLAHRFDTLAAAAAYLRWLARDCDRTATQTLLTGAAGAGRI